MVDEFYFRKRRNDIVRLIRNDTDFADLRTHIGNLKSYLAEVKDTLKQDDPEMRLIYSDLLCRSAVAQDTIASKVLLAGAAWMRQIVSDPRVTLDPEMREKASQYCVKVSEMLIANGYIADIEKYKLFELASRHNPVVHLWKMTSMVNGNEHLGDKNRLNEATASLESYIRTLGKEVPNHFSLPKLYLEIIDAIKVRESMLLVKSATTPDKNALTYDSFVFGSQINSVVKRGWQYNFALAMVAYEAKQLVYSIVPLRAAIEDLHNLAVYVDPSHRDTYLTQKKYVEETLLRMYKEIGLQLRVGTLINTPEAKDFQERVYKEILSISNEDIDALQFFFTNSFELKKWGDAFHYFTQLYNVADGRNIISQQGLGVAYLYCWHRAFPSVAFTNSSSQLQECLRDDSENKGLGALILKLHHAKLSGQRLVTEQDRVRYFGYDPADLKIDHQASRGLAGILLDEIKGEIMPVSNEGNLAKGDSKTPSLFHRLRESFKGRESAENVSQTTKSSERGL